jgi:class 3 adenylate cyclase
MRHWKERHILPPEAWVGELVLNHAPFDWETRYGRDGMMELEGMREVTVLSCDIRSSTLLQRAAIDPAEYGRVMHVFITVFRQKVRELGGWFDKFTGDGLIAYWLEDAPGGPRHPATKNEYPDQMFTSEIFDEVVPHMHESFKEFRFSMFGENSRSLPLKFGLAIGVDFGKALLLEIGGAATILGPPVVGAVRMVDLGEPGETFANPGVGEVFERSATYNEPRGFFVERTWTREVKENPEGQWVYKLWWVSQPAESSPQHA